MCLFVLKYGLNVLIWLSVFEKGHGTIILNILFIYAAQQTENKNQSA